MTESGRPDWRDLCAAAANEKDTAKLTCLVDQIIEAFDRDASSRAETYSTAPTR